MTLRAIVARAAAVTVMTATTLLMASAPASAGVPDQHRHEGDFRKTQCADFYLEAEDHVNFTKPNFWNATKARVSGEVRFTYTWTCPGDPPAPPKVTIRDEMRFLGRDIHVDEVSINVSKKDPNGAIPIKHNQKNENKYELTYDAPLKYDYYRIAKHGEPYSNVSAEGRNLSYIHKVEAIVEGQAYPLRVESEARD